MTSKKCPRCGHECEAVASRCVVCSYSFFAAVSAIEPGPVLGPPAEPQRVIPQYSGPVPVHIVGDSFRKAGLKPMWEALHCALWTGSAVGFFLLFGSLTDDLGRAESAPKQAAAAGMNIGYMFVLYGLSRAGSEILKTLIRS